MAATVTGACICLGFWHDGSHGRWAILESGKGGLVGFGLTAVVVGAGGAVVEAMGKFSPTCQDELKCRPGAGR
jgi:diacylglycerol kinase (CTP)